MNKLFVLFCLTIAIYNIESKSHSNNVLRKLKIENKIKENGFKFVRLTEAHSETIPMKDIFGTNDIDGGNCEIVFRINSKNSAVTLFKMGNEESNIQSQIGFKNGAQNTLEVSVVDRATKFNAAVSFPTGNVNVFDGKWHKIVVGSHEGVPDAYLDCKRIDTTTSAGRDGSSSNKLLKKYKMKGHMEPVSVGIVEQPDEPLNLDLHALHVYVNNPKSLYKCDDIPK